MTCAVSTTMKSLPGPRPMNRTCWVNVKLYGAPTNRGEVVRGHVLGGHRVIDGPAGQPGPDQAVVVRVYDEVGPARRVGFLSHDLGHRALDQDLLASATPAQGTVAKAESSDRTTVAPSATAAGIPATVSRPAASRASPIRFMSMLPITSHPLPARAGTTAPMRVGYLAGSRRQSRGTG